MIWKLPKSSGYIHKKLTNFSFPKKQAQWRGVLPFELGWLKSIPWSMR